MPSCMHQKKVYGTIWKYGFVRHKFQNVNLVLRMVMRVATVVRCQILLQVIHGTKISFITDNDNMNVIVLVTCTVYES